MQQPLWKVHLHGPLRVVRLGTGEEITRFRTQKTAALLAYLALTPGRRVSREALIDLFWPEQDLAAGRNALSVALSSLRSQLEPPGVAPGSVVEADRHTVALSARTVASDREESAEGTLLEGVFDDWAEAARARSHSRPLFSGLSAFVGWREGREARVAAHSHLSEALEIARRHPGGAVIHLGETVSLERTRRLAARVPSGALWLTPVARLALEESAALVGWRLEPIESGELIRASPPEPTPRFFGREVENERLETLLKTARTVTLVGPAGVGKSALARRIVGEGWPTTILLATLPPDTGPDGLARAALVALAPARADLPGSPIERLAALLSERGDAPVLWDNAEHVIDGLRELLKVLPGCALITSRRALELPGEAVLELAPLPAVISHEIPLEKLGIQPAVALFLQRAHVARPEFPFNERNAPEILALLEKLDGLPLAIELAASRLGEMSLARLKERLDESFTVLSAGPRGREARHRSLEAALEVSWRLLTPELAQAASRLAAFPDGWSDATRIELGASEEHLEALRASSLVYRSDGRWRMLESVRAFARPDAQVLLDWARAFAARAQAEAWGEALSGWLDRFTDERRNLDSALDAASPEIAGELLVLLERLYFTRSRWREIVARLGESEAKTPAGLVALGHGYIGVGDNTRAAAAFAEAERAAEDEPTHTAACEGQGIVWAFQGESERAAAMLEKVLEAHRSAEREAGAARALFHLAQLAASRHGVSVAEPLWDEGLAAAQRAGDLLREAALHNTMANAAVYQGRNALAIERFERARDIFARIGSPRGSSSVLANLGMLAWMEGRIEDAENYVGQGLAIDREIGDRPSIGRELCSLAHVRVWKGDFTAAFDDLAEAEALARDAGESRLLADVLLTRGEAVRRAGSTEAAKEPFFAGLSLHPDCGDAHIGAWALEEVAALALALGETSEAAQLFASAEKLRTELDAPLPAVAFPDRAALKEAVGPLPEPLGWKDARTLALSVCSA